MPAMNAITGAAVAIALAPAAAGADAATYRECATSMAAARMDCNFLYPPLAAIVAVPLNWISRLARPPLMTLVGSIILLSGVAVEARGRSAVDRLLVLLAAFTFAPVVYELMLGPVTLLSAATLYPIVRFRTRTRPASGSESCSRSRPRRSSCRCLSRCSCGGGRR